MQFKIILISVIIKFSFAISNDDECGVTDQTKGLIFGGQQVAEAEWPWKVAIFHRSEGLNYTFICGATLITRNKVITAAHCIYEKYSLGAKNVEDFELRLGTHDINKTEVTSLTLKPKSVTIHPEWNVYVTNYDADIAVMELEREIPISKFIRPICIWERRRGQPQFTEGIVVGWGFSESGKRRTENIARIIKTPVISNENCFLDQPEFASLSSNRTFCAGNKTGEGPCSGDSGSGMYFNNNNKYYLGGIVSASLLDASHNCDVMNYAIYTEVYKFIPWLSNKKFNDKPQYEVACNRYKNKRPKRPDYVTAAQPTSNEAFIGEFPHMALLMSNVENGNNFSCNGFLISDKFVVTAAHCLTARPVGKVVSVRLGSVTSGTMNSDGVPITVDIKVKNFVIHENYSFISRVHDIGLIELVEAAPLSYYIWPACLFDKLENSGRFWIATAYQLSKSGEDPKQYFLKIPTEEVANAECTSTFLKYARSQFSLTNQHMCTKAVIASFTLCRGSSGAPIQFFEDNAFYVGGISSFGRECPRSLYTVCSRIASYIEWIEERVWTDESM